MIITSTASRVFLLSWIFAVLWVKEHLWWILIIAILVYLWHEVTFVMESLRRIDIPKATASDGSGADDGGDPDVWREPKPPRSSSRAKKS